MQNLINNSLKDVMTVVKTLTSTSTFNIVVV